MYKLFFQRTLDIILSFVVFVFCSPILFTSFILLTFANKGEAFFIQKRPAKNEKIFKIFKFKSMNDKRGPNGELLTDSERITRVGQFVRNTFLAEIPKLFNVLKVDMNLMGPRPLLVQYLSLYSNEQCKRHNVRPDITGWAQVKGRNAVAWPRRFELDVWYVSNISFLLDLKILWLTFLKVLMRDDISSETSTTMEAYIGN